jgi:enterochelin esterase-like enzyme
MNFVKSLFVVLVLMISDVIFVKVDAAPARTDWLTRAVEAPGVSYHAFESRAAGTRISYHLYTPAAYDQNINRRYPVVYWLHGSGGGVDGIRPLAAQIDKAIAAGRAPPFMVVFVNGLRLGMYVDWKDGSVPMETIIVRELLPHIDAQYRTIATRKGRMLDGFSMGGYGAARLGFKYPEIFAAVSIVGAGPLQRALTTAPRASGRTADDVLRQVYGGDPAYFTEVSPRQQAVANALRIAQDSQVRMVIGSRDETFRNNEEFHQHLTYLGIPHDWIVVEGVGHDPLGLLQVMGDRYWEFHRRTFK